MAETGGIRRGETRGIALDRSIADLIDPDTWRAVGEAAAAQVAPNPLIMESESVLRREERLRREREARASWPFPSRQPGTEQERGRDAAPLPAPPRSSGGGPTRQGVGREDKAGDGRA